MAGNIFDQLPPPAPAVAPPSAAVANGASVQSPNPPATPAASTPQPRRTWGCFKTVIGFLFRLAVLGMLALGYYGWALPTDGLAQGVGNFIIVAARDSLTTLGYVLSFLFIASAMLGWVIGRALKK